MCGIVGAIDLEGQRRFDPTALGRMLASLTHRGPDDGHVFEAPGISMGTRRLSIVDLEGGRQPMGDPTGRVQVSFNGELFDYPVLREALLADGHALQTHCDTEAWVYLYLERGPAIFEQARGQFAVAIWDASRRRLLLARDRTGICPLHVCRVGGWLLWASEIKALLASGMIEPRADLRGIDCVMSFFASGTRRTCFQGVEALWPGHYMHIEGGRATTRRYWDLDFPPHGEGLRAAKPGDLAGALEEKLRHAVARRLRGDVPVATYISGGLDSTVMLGLASAQEPSVASFSIGFEAGAGPDESPRSAEAASVLGSPLTLLRVSGADIAGAVPDLVAAAESPIIDTADACLLLLARRVVAAGFKVALTGEGADEALGGYPWYKAQRAMSLLGTGNGGRLPALIRRALFRLVGPSLGSMGPASPFEAHGVRPAQMDLYDPMMRARRHFYTPEVWSELADHRPFDDLDIDPGRMARWDPLNQSLYVEYKLMLPGHLLLGKGDRVSMAASLEARYPFLDEDVVDFCAKLAPEYKLRGWTEKWLLRRVAARTLPPAIAHRPKHMFKAAPVFWTGQRPRWVDQLLSPESLRATGYFKRSAIEAEEAAMTRAGLASWSPRHFVTSATYTAVITTQLWHHLYLGGGLCELPPWTPPTGQ